MTAWAQLDRRLRLPYTICAFRPRSPRLFCLETRLDASLCAGIPLEGVHEKKVRAVW
jgi:hypothetical protein